MTRTFLTVYVVEEVQKGKMHQLATSFQFLLWIIQYAEENGCGCGCTWVLVWRVQAAGARLGRVTVWWRCTRVCSSRRRSYTHRRRPVVHTGQRLRQVWERHRGTGRCHRAARPLLRRTSCHRRLRPVTDLPLVVPWSCGGGAGCRVHCSCLGHSLTSVQTIDSHYRSREAWCVSQELEFRKAPVQTRHFPLAVWNMRSPF